MARPLSASKMLSLFTAEGLMVREAGHWRTHNRNHIGPWGPVHGVMLHHTGDYSSQAQMLALCQDGHTLLPGPLCHGVIDKGGVLYLVGYGRTNHAGLGDRDVLDAVIAEHALPPRGGMDTDGNRHFYGFEAINRGDGVDPWPPAQVEAMVRASAALLRGHRWGTQGTTSVIGHLEWQVGKPDPRGHDFPGMDVVRTRVANRLAHTPSWSPNGSSTADTYKVKDGDTLSAIAVAHRTTWRKLWALNKATLPNPHTIKRDQVIRLK